MKVNLHIERLILDGLPLEAKDGAAVRAAIEAELVRLLTENAGAANWQTSVATPNLRADSIELTNASQPAQIGQQIAGSIYGGISKAE